MVITPDIPVAVPGIGLYYVRRLYGPNVATALTDIMSAAGASMPDDPQHIVMRVDAYSNDSDGITFVVALRQPGVNWHSVDITCPDGLALAARVSRGGDLSAVVPLLEHLIEHAETAEARAAAKYILAIGYADMARISFAV